MNKKTFRTLTLLLSLGAALPLYAMAGHHDGGHQSATAMNHGAATSHEGLAELGAQTVDGVKAVAQLGDVRAAMAEAGQSMTHHLQIMFTDPAAKKMIATGTAAVKVTTPAGEVLPAQPLHGMDGHFGVDLTLTAAGPYKFAVGTKLPDGKIRQYEFSAIIQ